MQNHIYTYGMKQFWLEFWVKFHWCSRFIIQLPRIESHINIRTNCIISYNTVINGSVLAQTEVSLTPLLSWRKHYCVLVPLLLLLCSLTHAKLVAIYIVVLKGPHHLKPLLTNIVPIKLLLKFAIANLVCE